MALARIVPVLGGQRLFASVQNLTVTSLFQLRLLYQMPLTAPIPCGRLSSLLLSCWITKRTVNTQNTIREWSVSYCLRQGESFSPHSSYTGKSLSSSGTDGQTTFARAAMEIAGGWENCLGSRLLTAKLSDSFPARKETSSSLSQGNPPPY